MFDILVVSCPRSDVDVRGRKVLSYLYQCLFAQCGERAVWRFVFKEIALFNLVIPGVQGVNVIWSNI